MALHSQLVDDFLKRFSNYYGELLAYRQQPTPIESARLDAAFDTLFTTLTGYNALDERIAKTLGKKADLLLVLKHPELPLHNNSAELAARQRVRKRDVSFGPRTQDGKKAWDTFMSLVATTRVGCKYGQETQPRPILGRYMINPRLLRRYLKSRFCLDFLRLLSRCNLTNMWHNS